MDVFWLQMAACSVWEVCLTVFWMGAHQEELLANVILYSLSYAGPIVSWHFFISLKFRFRVSPSHSTRLCITHKQESKSPKEWFLDSMKVICGSSDFQIKKIMHFWHWISMHWNWTLIFILQFIYLFIFLREGGCFGTSQFNVQYAKLLIICHKLWHCCANIV